ncbi:YdcF family protein [Microbulbifer sp. TYP-18]|uniref:YdcF family protein n=1 Tax=Microbulbifer sp. TYP-18 TaxID=3230024 RepID=UPI0034C611BB
MELHTSLTSLLLPPLAPLLGLLAAFILCLFPSSSWLFKLSLPLAMVSFAALWICATPAFSVWLGKQLGELQLDSPGPPQAVVVLGGGRYRSLSSGSERLSATSLERVVGAAQGAPAQLPILVAGGRVLQRDQDSEADMMVAVLQQLLRRPVTWRDGCSRTTAENAVNSAAILHDSGIERIVLVTHWWHMPRAARVFARAGLQVQPLPVGVVDELPPRTRGALLMWIPSAAAMLRTQTYWRELLGQFWYHWRPMPPVHKC